MSNVGIIGVGHYMPEKKLTNFDLEKMVDTTNEWIITRTGISERRVAGTHERNSHLAVKAAKEALKNAKLDPHNVELIIVATISSDTAFPSVACLVQKAIHARQAAAFDIAAACSGFPYGITTAKQFIQSGMFKNALVIASEKITPYIDWNDRSTCVLFGDGAGACVLAKVRGNRGILSEYLYAEGHYGELMELIAKDRKSLDQKVTMMDLPRISMQGQELFKVAVKSMVKAAQVAIKKAGLKLSDIDWIVPHQANDRIISAVAKMLKVPKDRVVVNIDRFGNMSSASSAVAFYEAVSSGRIKRGHNVVLVAFGAGLTSAANVIRM